MRVPVAATKKTGGDDDPNWLHAPNTKSLKNKIVFHVANVFVEDLYFIQIIKISFDGQQTKQAANYPQGMHKSIKFMILFLLPCLLSMRSLDILT